MSGTDAGGWFDALFDRDLSLVLVVLAVIYVAYVLAGVAFGYGLRGQLNSIANLTFYVGVFGMLALALNLHWGYTGLFNIGIVGFMGIGIYVTALVSKPPSPRAVPHRSVASASRSASASSLACSSRGCSVCSSRFPRCDSARTTSPS